MKENILKYNIVLCAQNSVLFFQKSAIPPSVEREQGFVKKEATVNRALEHTNTFSMLIFFLTLRCRSQSDLLV